MIVNVFVWQTSVLIVFLQKINIEVAPDTD